MLKLKKLFYFKNEPGSYLIRGCPDKIPGISYRNQKKGWMNNKNIFGMTFGAKSYKCFAKYSRENYFC